MSRPVLERGANVPAAISRLPWSSRRSAARLSKPERSQTVFPFQRKASQYTTRPFFSLRGCGAIDEPQESSAREAPFATETFRGQLVVGDELHDRLRAELQIARRLLEGQDIGQFDGGAH